MHYVQCQSDTIACDDPRVVLITLTQENKDTWFGRSHICSDEKWGNFNGLGLAIPRLWSMQCVCTHYNNLWDSKRSESLKNYDPKASSLVPREGSNENPNKTLKLTLAHNYHHSLKNFLFSYYLLVTMPHIGHFDIKPWKRLVDTKKWSPCKQKPVDCYY